MRGVIIKESEILKNALMGDVGKKPMETLRIMTKKYFSEGKTKDEIFNEINEYMEENYIGYKASKWQSLITQMIKSVSKYNNYEIIDVNEVHISEGEWNKILELKNTQLEKLAFILLVYQKINIIKNPDSDGWINQNFSDILTESCIRRGVEQKALLHKLYSMGYISQKQSCDATSLKINYIDLNNEIKITINNFTNVIGYYDMFKNNIKYIECEVCNKMVAQKGNKPKKYCSKCLKNKQKEWEKSSKCKL